MPGTHTFPGGPPVGPAELQPADGLIFEVLRLINSRTFGGAFSPTNPAETSFAIRLQSVHDRPLAGFEGVPPEPGLTSFMWHLDGIHDGPFFWLDPTFNRVRVDGVAVVYSVPNLNRDEPSVRVFFDEVSLWSQLGVNLALRPVAHGPPANGKSTLIDEPVA